MTGAEHATLTVREHGRLSSVRLTPEQVRALAASPAGLSIAATGTPHLFDIEARQVVGTVVCPGLRLIIEPKVSAPNLLYLIGFLGRAPRIEGRAQLAPAADLLAAMQAVYCRALEDALRYGLLSGYRERHEELKAPRGRIDALALASRRFGVIPPVPCTHLDFTPDIEVNRRMLAAAKLLLRCGVSDPVSWGRLKALTERFEGVEHKSYRPVDLRPLPRDHRLERYGAAPTLADVILRHHSIALRHGDLDTAGFLVDMDQVFEAFVAESLRLAMRAAGYEWRRHPSGLYLDEDRRVKLEPDVLWGTTSRPRLVIDVKYKRVTSPPNPDVYQMAAYCSALGLRAGVLVYADARPEVLRLRNGTAIHVLPYPPDGSPSDLRHRADALAATLRKLVAVPDRDLSRATA